MADDSPDEDRSRAEVYPSPPPPDGVRRYTVEQDDISLVEFLNVVLRHRWKIVGPATVLAIMAAVFVALQPADYTSDATLVPQTGQSRAGQLSQITGMAAQFGIDVPTGQAGQSPQFYADLLTSRRLLEEAVTSQYVPRLEPTGESADTTLVELYELEEHRQGVAIFEAVSRLEEAVSVSTNSETGVVEVSVSTAWPQISQQVAQRLIELVNQFNNRVRQSQASAEAEFVQERLQEARRELRAVEDSLEAFLESNVSWQQSPELRFRHDRLQRQVSLKQEVYSSLATRYEEARISEVKSTPVVTTVVRPQVPVESDSDRFPIWAVAGWMIGMVLGVFWAFGADFVERLQEDDSAVSRELLALTEEAVGDVRQAGRRIRRAFTTKSGSTDE